MAAQSKVVPHSGYEMAIAFQCLKRLDTIKGYKDRKDERPKTKSALQNMLNKETSIVFVSSVLSILYDYQKPVVFSHVDDIYKDDKELDREIAELVLKKCSDVKRRLHVLPCDSNMHIQIRSQIKSWYDNKHSHFDRQDPVRGIAVASCLDYDLSADQIYTELVTLGYLKVEGSTVQLQLPGTRCLQALEEGLKKWETKIVEHLSDVTVKNYKYFADLIIDVNAAIQGVTAEEMGHYCEVHFSKQYPLYKATLDNSVGRMIENLSLEVMDVTEAVGAGKEEKEAEGNCEEMESADELPTKTALIFPLNIKPEAAHALVQLGKSGQSSMAPQDLLSHIQQVCSITYVVSPKYVLSSVADKKKTSKVTGDFTVKLHLGETIAKMERDVSEITQLALLLSFPGKGSILKKYYKRMERHMAYFKNNPNKDAGLSIPMEDIKEILKSFQQHIFNHSQQLVQRKRATVVYNDVAAESRCRQKLFSLLDSVNTDQSSVFTEKEFSKTLMDLSFEESYLPSETVIEKLTDLGYLKLQGNTVCYNPSFRTRKYQNDTTDIQKFLTRWSTDLKQRDGTQPFAGQLRPTSSQCRKRSSPIHVMDSAGAKRQKILDL